MTKCAKCGKPLQGLDKYSQGKICWTCDLGLIIQGMKDKRDKDE